MRNVSAALLLLVLGSCSFMPPPDQPASVNRMGRFVGLIANCGCSDITRDRMLADYPQALAERYSDAQIGAMHGYVDLGAHERWDNQYVICAEVCAQSCKVNSVTQPLGGKPAGDGKVCAVTERDLHLTEGMAREEGMLR